MKFLNINMLIFKLKSNKNSNFAFSLCFFMVQSGLVSPNFTYSKNLVHDVLIPKVDSVYIQILTDSAYIYALSQNGRLVIWNTATLEKIHEQEDILNHYSAIAKNKFNEIYIGTENGKILQLNKVNFLTNHYLTLKEKSKILDLFFNSKNKIFAILKYGIYNPLSNEIWDRFKQNAPNKIVKRRFFVFFWKKTNYFFERPYYTFVDSQDRVWMIINYGEWGGSLQIFDARNNKPLNIEFIYPKNVSFNPQSALEDEKSNIYITSGLAHTGFNGSILKPVDNKLLTIYNNSDGIFADPTLVIGPGAFNKLENRIYFATNQGIYRAEVSKDNKIQSFEFVFDPNVNFKGDYPISLYPIPIKKIDFLTNNRLIFLTKDKGIGVYDGKGIIMLK